jgi:UDP-N-acetyl-D-mannosaminuronic acid dehydrogenase
MAFKGESDDIRSSLAYKLKRILRFKAADVLCADPYVKTDSSLVSQQEVMDRADLLVIGAPHRRYAELSTAKPVVDIWDIRGQGVRV